MLEGLCNPHMVNILSCPSIEGFWTECNGFFLQWLKILLKANIVAFTNSSCFILGQNLEAFVYQNIRSCCTCTSTNFFLEDLCKYHFKYIVVHVVCMLNKAASYSTMLYPTKLLTLSPPPVTSHLMSFNRAISITAPRRWNNDLPPELRTISLPSPPLLPITRHHLHPAPLFITLRPSTQN